MNIRDAIYLGIHYMDPSVCCENAFHTRSKYEVVVRTSSVCSAYSKFLFDVFVLLSGTPLVSVVAVVSDTMGLELCFLARTMSGSVAARRFCVALPPSPFAFGDIMSRDKSKS